MAAGAGCNVDEVEFGFIKEDVGFWFTYKHASNLSIIEVLVLVRGSDCIQLANFHESFYFARLLL